MRWALLLVSALACGCVLTEGEVRRVPAQDTPQVGYSLEIPAGYKPAAVTPGGAIVASYQGPPRHSITVSKTRDHRNVVVDVAAATYKADMKKALKDFKVVSQHKVPITGADEAVLISGVSGGGTVATITLMAASGRDAVSCVAVCPATDPKTVEQLTAALLTLQLK